MSDGAEPSAERGTEDPGRETVATRLESVEQYLEYLKETNAYYDWLDPEILTVERGEVEIKQPHSDRTKPPQVGPSKGINGGILMTLADAAGMAAVVSDALEPIPLATASMDMSFHNGVDEAHIVKATVIDIGTTLATSRIEIYPVSDRDADDPRMVATGEATARLF